MNHVTPTSIVSAKMRAPRETIITVGVSVAFFVVSGSAAHVQLVILSVDMKMTTYSLTHILAVAATTVADDRHSRRGRHISTYQDCTPAASMQDYDCRQTVVPSYAKSLL